MRLLTPAEGRYLTEADKSLQDRARTVATKIYLAANADPAQWTEVDEARALQIRRAHQEDEAADPANWPWTNTCTNATSPGC